MIAVLAYLRLHFSDAGTQFSEAVRSWKARDTKNALRWGRKAARKLPLAKVAVAQWLLFAGEGPSAAEASEAIALLEAAAIEGSVEGQQVLGSCYLNGDGVERNVDKAVDWIRKAADAGSVDSQLAMVRLYTLEEHIPSDETIARHYAEILAERGHSEVLAALGAESEKS